MYEIIGYKPAGMAQIEYNGSRITVGIVIIQIQYRDTMIAVEGYYLSD